MRWLAVALGRFAHCESGATAIEYGLIAALMPVTANAGMSLFGGSLSNLFGSVANRSTHAMSGG